MMEEVWSYFAEVFGKDVAGRIEKYHLPFKPPNLFSNLDNYIAYLLDTLQSGMIVRLLPTSTHRLIAPGTEVIYLFWATEDEVKSTEDLVIKVLYKHETFFIKLFEVEIVGYGMSKMPFFDRSQLPIDIPKSIDPKNVPLFMSHRHFFDKQNYKLYLLQTLRPGMIMRVYDGNKYNFTKTGTLVLFLRLDRPDSTYDADILFIDKTMVRTMTMDVLHADIVDASACDYSVFRQ